tara:strand:+ start:791 stop:1156 length:366 start_codon:yes stop_codon:yes gene_type:complete
MKLTKKHLRQIIREELQVLAEHDRPVADRFVDVHKGGLTAKFDRDSVILDGEVLEQELLAREVSSEAEWKDNSDRMGAYAAQALRDKYDVVTITDAEHPRKGWTASDFIDLKHRIADTWDD